MRKAPTPEDIATANAIIGRTEYGVKNRIKFAQGDYLIAAKLSKDYTGYYPDGVCNSCRLKVYDNLREIAGLTYARSPLGEDMVSTRRAICHTCPAYHPSTDSCGRLILDAISPMLVNVDGQQVEPCGCIITLKTMFRSEQCPASKWPK